MNLKRNPEGRHFSSQQQDPNQSTSNKQATRNKENINLYNEWTSMLQYYQSSSLLKKKTSLPTSMVSPKKIIDNLMLRQALQTKKSRNKVSVSQNIGQKNLSLSPIEAKQKSISGKNRCTFHTNKRAKYFEFDSQMGALFYCEECAVGKILNGNLYSIESYSQKMGSNKKRENQSVSRANFWSVDENSLLSNSPFLIESSETFNSSTDVSEDKSRELREFKQTVVTLQDECHQLIENCTNNAYQQQFNSLNQELQQLLYIINIQTMKLIQQLQTHNSLQTVRDVQGELESILTDIRTNEHNILNNMQIKPFKYIIAKYKEKIKGHIQTINSCQQSRQLFDLDDRLQKLTRIKKLLKKEFDTEEQELLSTRRKLTSTVYISFENKEMFMAAAQAQKVKEEADLVQVGEKCHLLESPNFIQN